ncbi:MAG: hypothetical protein PHH75_03415 [Candidatus Omnitrophica bacterium]|nr:hypothetical protein [Candidatus Omnitrophota bacterium]MDD5574207.1 hypothetical protein [Candidatus Omnitrophota bacterium]
MKIDPARIKYSADFIIHRLLIVLFFAILVVYCSREIADLDIWLHLKTGEVIAKTGRVPLNDIFSFTISGKPWINHEWLFQLAGYASYRTGGADGLIVMQNIVVAATFLLLLFFGLRRTHPVLVFIILYLTMLVVSYRFTVRPDIFSLLFLSLYMFILKECGGRRSILFWSLPVLQLIWVNMHGFSFLGPVIVLWVLAGELLQKKIPLPQGWKKNNSADTSQIVRLCTIFVLMLAASLVNPHGFKGAAYPLAVLGQISQEGKVVFKYIQELARPISWSNILNPRNFLTYKVLILVSLFSFRVNYRRINPADILIWLFFLGFSLLAVRNIAYFGIAAAFLTLDNFSVAFKDPAARPRLPSGKIIFLGRYLFVLFLFYYPIKGAMQYLETASFDFRTYELKSDLWGVARDRYPGEAVRFLLAHPFPQNMFNDFNSGSYLVGTAYPQRRVFIDGRTELYGPDFFMSYVRAGEGNKDALKMLLERYHIKGFFLTNPHRDLHVGLIKFLYKDPRWKCVYFDDAAVIFLRDLPEHAALIKEFNIDLKNWKPPVVDFPKLGLAPRYPTPFLKRAHLLNVLGCHDAAWREAGIALEIMPNNAEALKYAEDYYFEKGEYLEAYKYARLNLIYGGGQPWMRARLALIYARMNDMPKAERVIAAVLKQYPDFAQGYYVQALILKEKDPDGAMKALRRAAKLAPREPKYAESLGNLLAKQGETQEAMAFWKAAYQYDASNPELKSLVEKD